MAANSGMSLRQLAKELGVSHSLLVLWRQGKRRLAPKLEARYHQLVTSVTTLEQKTHMIGREETILSPPRLPFRHLGPCC